MTTLNVARVYLRVSSEDQDLQRQEAIIGNARESGYYVAAVYREKASGARSDRPELFRNDDFTRLQVLDHEIGRAHV